jgi:hypothetical protein
MLTNALTDIRLCVLDDAHANDANGNSQNAVVQADGKWQLLRDGKPYLIKGAGGGASRELLRDIGGNSIRTWSTTISTSNSTTRSDWVSRSASASGWGRSDRVQLLRSETGRTAI